MNDPYVIDYVKRYFPNHTTQSVADHLRLTVNQVRTIAKNHRIQKCEKYKTNLKRQLVIDRKKWFEDNIPALNPTFLQEQIIFGSVLGDGYISRGADRSVNCYYQEHFGESQRGIGNGSYFICKIYNLLLKEITYVLLVIHISLHYMNNYTKIILKQSTLHF